MRPGLLGRPTARPLDREAALEARVAGLRDDPAGQPPWWPLIGASLDDALAVGRAEELSRRLVQGYATAPQERGRDVWRELCRSWPLPVLCWAPFC